MSWVADAIATRPSITMLHAKKPGRFSVKPSTVRLAPPMNWNSTTCDRLVPSASRNGLHKGLNTQAKPMMPVQNEIVSLPMPMLL